MRQSLKLLHTEQAKKGGDKECGIPKQAEVKDVNAFRQSDSFSGLLVTLKDARTDTVNPPEFEVFFSPIPGFKRFVSEGDMARRIVGLEVSKSVLSISQYLSVCPSVSVCLSLSLSLSVLSLIHI